MPKYLYCLRVGVTRTNRHSSKGTEMNKYYDEKYKRMKRKKNEVKEFKLTLISNFK